MRWAKAARSLLTWRTTLLRDPFTPIVGREAIKGLLSFAGHKRSTSGPEAEQSTGEGRISPREARRGQKWPRICQWRARERSRVAQERRRIHDGTGEPTTPRRGQKWPRAGKRPGIQGAVAQARLRRGPAEAQQKSQAATQGWHRSAGEPRRGQKRPRRAHNEPKVARCMPRRRNLAGPADGWEGEESSRKSVAN